MLDEINADKEIIKVHFVAQILREVLNESTCGTSLHLDTKDSNIGLTLYNLSKFASPCFGIVLLSAIWK
jgi:hypothetical protein